jgi:ABC-type transport system substrate-binding protein
MTADDVIFSMQLSGGPGSKNGSGSNIKRLWLADGGYAKAIDKYTVEIDTGTPQFDVLYWARTPTPGGNWIISKKQYEQEGPEKTDQNCAGTGPWEFVEAKTGEYWKFKAVPNHWRKTPEFAEMVLWEIPEEATRVAEFQSGKLDTLQAAWDSLPTIAAVPGTKLMRPGGGTQMQVFIYGDYYAVPRPGYDPTLPWVSKSPDPTSADWARAVKVRQAIALAIDRDSIIKNLFRGEGTPAILWPWLGHEQHLPADMKWKFDPTEAKRLLAEAGYPNGFDITLTPVLRGSPSEKETCEAIAPMLQAVGIRVKLNEVADTVIQPQQQQRSYKGLTCQSTSEQPEPILQMPIWSTVASSFNGGVEHPVIEDLAAKARATFDRDERFKIEVQYAKFLFDNALAIGVNNVPAVVVVGPKIDDWSANWIYGDSRVIAATEFVHHRK